MGNGRGVNMEEKIKKELKKINKMSDSLTRKYERTLRPSEHDKIKLQLARLDGRFEAYMEVLQMIKEA
jgi:hypothetical protein